VTLSNDTSSALQIFILVVGVYRAVTMRRGFIDPVYRSRALWSAVLMFTIILTNAMTFVNLPNDTIDNIIGFSPFLALVLVIYAYVDRSVMVAMSTDFFHRNTLHWLQFRRPGYGLMTAGALVTFGIVIALPQYIQSSGPTTTAPFWVAIGLQVFFLFAIFVLGISALALGVASRRTSDRNLRRSIRLLGYALGLFVASLAILTASNSAPAIVAGNILTLGATYFLYRSTMSLTALGRFEKA
jgi:hypothetical protein